MGNTVMSCKTDLFIDDDEEFTTSYSTKRGKL